MPQPHLSRRLLPLVLAVAPVASVDAAPAQRPNVLMIICDDLNTEVGCYGNPQVRTPHIDSLAARGVRFDRAFSQWPSCAPSRISFLSGWSPERTRVWNFDKVTRSGAMADAVYLPGHFKAHGYAAARLDKIFHIGHDDPTSWTITEEPWRDPATGAFKPIWTGIELETLGLTDRVLESGSRPELNAETGVYAVLDDSVKDEELFDGRTAARAVELLDQFATERQPFFLAVGFRRPHLPWVLPKRYFDLYPPETIQLPPSPPDQPSPVSDAVLREMRARYYAAVTFADSQVGKLLAALRRTGLEQNTIVVLLGDHGYALGERDGFFAKGNLWDRSLRTSLIISRPGEPNPGSASSALVGLLDLYPTLVDLCALPAPAVPLDGRSLRPHLDDPAAPGREYLRAFTAKREGGLERTVRTADYRLIADAENRPTELHHLASDPEGRHNVLADPAHAAALARLIPALSRPE